ncbi:MAG TPA: TerC family protein [Polyangia bacterium]|nr:TerC family protein [Polyangia bacterium]
MEIVLGIDNIIFIAILSDKVGHGQGAKVRRLGLGLALIMRIGLLLTLSWLMGLTAPLFSVLGQAFSGRDLVLLAGGLFLMAKATHELYEKVEGGDGDGEAGEGDKLRAPSAGARTASFGSTLAQILALDIVFSLDSVITAVGMVPHIPIMITAMVLAVIVMLVFAEAVSGFISRHPSMKVLALSFLLLIGVLLVADSFDKHINKGYVYFAMAFSLGVEVINLRVRKLARRRKKPEGANAGANAGSSAATS